VTGTDGVLPTWRRPLAVVAHPDDESFGLGAVLASFVAGGARPAVLCLTRGEASSLHAVPGELGEIRAAELAAAARILEVEAVELLDHPDGALARIGVGDLAAAVLAAARRWGSDGLIGFDVGGVTGHPDHVAATAAALRAAGGLGLGVLGWTLPAWVARRLGSELGAGFLGREAGDIDLVLTVDRARQLRAVRAHPSQAVPSSALWRRLELLGDREYLTWLRDDPGATTRRR
jgi:LmbE family N-acetylglucosaminyl deacetylase